MVKNFIIVLCLIASITPPARLLAQEQGVGIHFGGYDFYGPQTHHYLFSDQNHYSFNDIKSGYDTSNRRNLKWDPMVKFTYWFKASKYFDINLGLSLASLVYPDNNSDTLYTGILRNNISGVRHEKFLGEFDARFNYNILPKESWIVSPYVFAGITASYHDNFFGADIPLGLGLNFSLSRNHNIYLNLESAYKVSATDHDVNHLQHSIGFVYWFKRGYRVAVTTSSMAPDTAVVNQIKDTDGDGVEDAVDKCPTIPGLAQFDGCPDTDGDGISDADDACPLVAGLAQFQGCPDSDNDGIPDNKDKCPYAAGTAEHDGCPIPDRDNDGFPDDVDRCPDVYSKTNNGCPEIQKEVITQVEKAAKAIFFQEGKATIKPVSFKSLDAVVKILKSDASLNCDVEGHTDNVQPKGYTNMDLSQRRADAVKAYIVSKGVSGDRVTAQGFGETQPVADNKTEPGRAQNRRTVLKLRNYSK